MSSLIDRQAAIKVASKECFELRGVFGRIEDGLNELPSVQTESCTYWDDESKFCALYRLSAQPERKKGRWIRNNNGTYSCSLCQSWIPNEQHYYARYCLFCGAKMDGEENEANAEC